MIVEWLVSVGTTISVFVASLFGTWTIPASWSSAFASVADWSTEWAGLGVWVNLAVLGSVLLIVIAVYGIAFGIKLARAAASYLPFFGGAG